MQREKFFDAREGRLVYVQQAATEEFWDGQWSERYEPNRYKRPRNHLVVETTKKYLPKGSRILEGGCGLAEKSIWLKEVGYEAVAVDFAEKTIELLQRDFPDLETTLGDVRALPFEDNSFDGYWSLGVIEHFWSGYSEIRDEMARVIRPGGYLFLTFPYMSPLRRLRARAGRYPLAPTEEPSGFYQFALDWRRIAPDFESHGFALVESRPYLGLRGLKDEYPHTSGVLDRMRHGGGKAIAAALSKGTRRFSSHCVLLVLRRTG